MEGREAGGAAAQQRVRVAVWLVAAALVAGIVVQTVNGLWPYDIWTYVAPVREVAEHGFGADHSLLAGTDDDPLLNPFTVVWGFVAGAFDLGGLTVLRIAAVVNLVALVLAHRALARRFSHEPHAGALLIGCTLLAWGVNPWRWAGYFDLNSVGSVLPLGSAAGWAMGVFAIALTVDGMRGPRRGPLLAAGGLHAVAFLVHPMSGMTAVLFSVGCVAALTRREHLVRPALLAGAAAVTSAVLLAWPFFPVAGLLGGSDDYDEPHRALFRRVLLRTFLALPGLVVLADRLRRRRRDPLAFATVLLLAVFLAAWATGRAAFGRVLPGAMLGAHLALVQMLPGWWRSGATARWRRAAIAVGVAVGLAGSTAGVARLVPRSLLPGGLGDEERLVSITEPYESLPAGIERDDVVLASEELALAVAALSGKSIATDIPQPFVEDIDDRRATEARLRELLDRPDAAVRRYRDAGIRWLVLTPSDAEPWLRRRAPGDVVVDDGELVIVRLP